MHTSRRCRFGSKCTTLIASLKKHFGPTFEPSDKLLSYELPTKCSPGPGAAAHSWDDVYKALTSRNYRGWIPFLNDHRATSSSSASTTTAIANANPKAIGSRSSMPGPVSDQSDVEVSEREREREQERRQCLEEARRLKQAIRRTLPAIAAREDREKKRSEVENLKAEQARELKTLRALIATNRKHTRGTASSEDVEKLRGHIRVLEAETARRGSNIKRLENQLKASDVSETAAIRWENLLVRGGLRTMLRSVEEAQAELRLLERRIRQLQRLCPFGADCKVLLESVVSQTTSAEGTPRWQSVQLATACGACPDFHPAGEILAATERRSRETAARTDQLKTFGVDSIVLFKQVQKLLHSWPALGFVPQDILRMMLEYLCFPKRGIDVPTLAGSSEPFVCVDRFPVYATFPRTTMYPGAVCPCGDSSSMMFSFKRVSIETLRSMSDQPMDSKSRADFCWAWDEAAAAAQPGTALHVRPRLPHAACDCNSDTKFFGRYAFCWKHGTGTVIMEPDDVGCEVCSFRCLETFYGMLHRSASHVRLPDPAPGHVDPSGRILCSPAPVNGPVNVQVQSTAGPEAEQVCRLCALLTERQSKLVTDAFVQLPVWYGCH